MYLNNDKAGDGVKHKIGKKKKKEMYCFLPEKIKLQAGLKYAVDPLVSLCFCVLFIVLEK